MARGVEPVLDLVDLNVHFESRDGKVNAVCHANLTIGKGQVLGLIGETGCGKSVLGQSVLRLLPASARMSGRILFQGTDILALPQSEVRKIRGQLIAFICQNPAEALNPVLRNGTQIMESVKINRKLPRRERRDACLDLLRSLRFTDPEFCMRSYPLQLSGGMKQRVLAAMGMSGRPSLLIADEPTKGLDALVRGHVIATLERFMEATSSSALVITHDLRFASRICDSIAVMYAGEIVERGPFDEVFGHPRHPYLQALIDSQPVRGLHVLKGSTCSLIDLPPHCRFYDRCPKAVQGCREAHPETVFVNSDHEVRCLRIA